MEEVEGIAQQIEEVEAIVDLEKSKVEEEPPNENERSNNREENTNNDTSIEVPAANILTTDKSELAILYEDVVNRCIQLRTLDRSRGGEGSYR